MRAGFLIAILVSQNVFGEIQISQKIKAPFKTKPQSRFAQDEFGNRTEVFLEIIRTGNKRALIHAIGETEIAEKNKIRDPLLGWETRVLEGKNKNGGGNKFVFVNSHGASNGGRELSFSIKVQHPQMKKHFQDGFGFATGTRLNKSTFVQIGSECYGYSQTYCAQLAQEFRDNVEFSD